MSTASAPTLLFPTTLERVMAYQYPELIEYYKDRLGLSGEAALELFADVKRFLYLAASTETKLTPLPIIDKGWHGFRDYSESYERFCFDFFGKYVHHRPRPYLTPYIGPKRTKTISLAREIFGELGPNWENPDGSEQGDCTCSCECGD